MSESRVHAFTPPTSALVAFTRIYQLVFSTTSTNGLPSSVTASMKQKSYSQTTGYGRGGHKALVLSPPQKP